MNHLYNLTVQERSILAFIILKICTARNRRKQPRLNTQKKPLLLGNHLHYIRVRVLFNGDSDVTQKRRKKIEEDDDDHSHTVTAYRPEIGEDESFFYFIFHSFLGHFENRTQLDLSHVTVGSSLYLLSNCYYY